MNGPAGEPCVVGYHAGVSQLTGDKLTVSWLEEEEGKGERLGELEGRNLKAGERETRRSQKEETRTSIKVSKYRCTEYSRLADWRHVQVQGC